MKLGNKIEKIISIDSEAFKITIKYSDGITGELNLAYLFMKPKNLAAEILRGQLFDSCYIESGALAWPNGLELCPDSLRMHLKIKKRNAA